MDCNGHVTDIWESSPPERRSSARIQKLKSEKALRASPKEKEEPVNKKTVKVFKRRKMEEPVKKKTRSVGVKVTEIGVSKLESQVAVLENGVSKLETEVTFPENGISKLETEVAVPNGRKNIVEGGEMVDTGVNGTIAGGDKSAYAMVTETLRIFNKHYLHFVQANAVFGRLRPKSIEAEAEEDAIRKENAILKLALARERTQHEGALHPNEGLRNELAQTKEEVKTSNEELKLSKANHQEIVKMNADLVQRNELRMEKVKELKGSNKILAKSIEKLELQVTRHLNRRQKLEEEIRELRALRDLGPPLTDDLRKQICEEYRKSDEINGEIMKIYSEGYELCRSRGKEKLSVANTDPSLLDSSDGEDNA